MARLVILWTRPYHLSAEEADRWVLREVRRLAAIDGVERAELAPLRNGGLPYAAEWNWMLELHLRAGVPARACIEAPACAEWLADLRLLGMRPAVVLVEGVTALAPEAG